MKNLLGVSVLVLVTSCSLLNAARTGDVNGLANGASNAAADARVLSDKQAKCDALRKQTVSYEEEYQIGGAVALALAGKTSGVFVEVSADLKAAKPTAGQKPKPATGEKTDLTLYLNKLGKSLAAFSSRPDIDWTFVVLDSATPNAFSAPGGYVFVTTGMLKLVDNEAQLAAVLAHEIGHVSGRHAVESYKKSKGGACEAAMVLGYGAGKAAGELPSEVREFESLLALSSVDLNRASNEVIELIADKTVGAIIDSGLGPDFEFAADKAAFDIMVFAGYDPREFDKVLGKLPSGGGFLTPHPSNDDRLKALQKVKETDYPGFPFEALKSPDNAAALKVVKK